MTQYKKITFMIPKVIMMKFIPPVLRQCKSYLVWQMSQMLPSESGGCYKGLRGVAGRRELRIGKTRFKSPDLLAS